MKTIKLEIIEEVAYERSYEVDDDFDKLSEDELHDALEDLWTNDDDGPTKGFVSVNERSIHIIQ